MYSKIMPIGYVQFFEGRGKHSNSFCLKEAYFFFPKVDHFYPKVVNNVNVVTETSFCRRNNRDTALERLDAIF